MSLCGRCGCANEPVPSLRGLFTTGGLAVQDMAVLTNAAVISEDTGMKLETADFSVLGTAKKVIHCPIPCHVLHYVR